MSHTGGVISFGPDEVKSINYRSTVPFIWIILEDGTQINLPLNVAEVIASRVMHPHLHKDD